jgi:hypothetical protein
MSRPSTITARMLQFVGKYMRDVSAMYLIHRMEEH